MGKKNERDLRLVRTLAPVLIMLDAKNVAYEARVELAHALDNTATRIARRSVRASR